MLLAVNCAFDIAYGIPKPDIDECALYNDPCQHGYCKDRNISASAKKDGVVRIARWH